MSNVMKKVVVAALFVVVTSGVALAWGSSGGSYGGGSYGGSIGGGPWTPNSDIGQRHIQMAQMSGGGTPDLCLGCHSSTDFSAPMTPPDISKFEYVNMGDSRACSSCHGSNVFTAQMGASRCGNCHPVGSSGGYR